ncbi:MAG: gamma-glutamyltransferase, partial [Pirellula sp.]
MTKRREFLSSLAAVAACGPTLMNRARADEVNNMTKPVIRGRSVAATVHPLASLAAASMFKLGGNAVDAAAAAALCLGVVDGHNSGIGGGCLILIRLADGSTHAIDGRETAPRLAHKNMYLRNGVGDVKLSQDGPLACGVPGQIAALKSAHSRFGKLPWQDLFEPAIRAAHDGIAMSSAVAASIKNEEQVLRGFASSSAVLFKADGAPYVADDHWVQKDLAETLKNIANKGDVWFYQGEFADRCSRFIKEQGGILESKDFSDYRAKDRPVLKSEYRGNQVLGFPPPSSGGLHILQMLQMLGCFSMKEVSESGRTARFYHLLAEAMKLAFADRAFYLGDSDFVEVPSFLASIEYTNELARKIDLSKATKVAGHISSQGASLDDEKKHTTHLSTADSQGNWVALTATVNTSWGNKMVVPGTGVMMNNEMDDFSVSPGVPNAFGLIGSEANSVEPGKRPLSSMSPSIVLDSGGIPVLACGAAGGPRIINATLQTIVRCLDYGMSVGDAIAESRVHHQWQPDTLFCEGSLVGSYQANLVNEQLIGELKKRGHNVKVSG